MVPDWEKLPRLLDEECDGPHGNRTEVYRFDRPDMPSLWYCQHCYIPAWRAQQTALAVEVEAAGTDNTTRSQ